MTRPPLAPLGMRRVSPFAPSQARRQPNRDGRVQVHMQAGMLTNWTQISTWVGGWDGLAAHLSPLMPLPALGQTATVGQDWIARTGPDELLVLAAPDSALLARIKGDLPAAAGHCLDLSHARCRLHLHGPGAVPSLQKLFALDFRESAFAIGSVRLSGSHHLPAMLHRQAPEAFDLYLHTTYAHDQVESVFDAALEWGVELLP